MLAYLYKKLTQYSIILFLVILLLLCYIIFQNYTILNNVSVNKDTVDAEYEIMNRPRSGVNYLQGIDVVYWINLDRSTDRNRNMMLMFQDNVFDNIHVERISAADGINPKMVYRKLNFMYKQKNDYEYACLLSHLNTVRKFSETNYNVALIMEDDLTLEFKKYWRKSIKEIIANAPNDWEIIQLCYITVNHDPTTFQLYEKNARNKCVSAAAYLINNHAAKRIIKGIYGGEKYNLENNILHHADCYLFSKCVTYTYKYPYFIYKTNNTSLLHPGDLKEHEQSKLKIIQMYKKLEKNVEISE